MQSIRLSFRGRLPIVTPKRRGRRDRADESRIAAGLNRSEVKEGGCMHSPGDTNAAPAARNAAAGSLAFGQVLSGRSTSRRFPSAAALGCPRFRAFLFSMSFFSSSALNCLPRKVDGMSRSGGQALKAPVWMAFRQASCRTRKVFSCWILNESLNVARGEETGGLRVNTCATGDSGTERVRRHGTGQSR